LESRQYVKCYKVQKFDTFDEAEIFAIDGFSDYAYEQSPFPSVTVPEELTLNWLIYPYNCNKVKR
jgi:hypothetical protein